MTKQTFTIGVLSLLVTLLPSFLIALAIFSFFGNFWAWFCITYSFIFLVGIISNNFIQKKINRDIIKLQTRLHEVSNQQSVEVSCSYCKMRNVVPVYLNQRNTFKCSKCQQVNLVIFQFAAAQVTVPLELPQMGTTLQIPETKDESRQTST